MAAEYLAGADTADPRCSSVFADLRGLPPLLIQVGEQEILFDDAARSRDGARAAGDDTTFQPWTHGIHVWPIYISAGLPESALAVEDLAAFFKAARPTRRCEGWGRVSASVGQGPPVTDRPKQIAAAIPKVYTLHLDRVLSMEYHESMSYRFAQCVSPPGCRAGAHLRKSPAAIPVDLSR